MTIQGKFGDPKTERDIRAAKRFNFVSLIVLICAMAAGFVLYLQLVENQKKLEIKSQELADSTDNLRRIRSELEAAQKSLAQREEAIESQLQDLSSSVENKQFKVALAQATAINSQMARNDSTGQLLVHLYAWKPQGQALTEINGYLKTSGYTVVREKSFDELPAWMGTQSAVYYYATSAQTQAQSIATRLSKISGQKFEAKMGNMGAGPDYGHDDWLHIHYLGASMPLRK